MTSTEQPSERAGNLLAALAVALADRIRTDTEAATGLTGAAPGALIGLDEMVDGGTVDDLRRALDLTPSGAVKLVDRLVAAGLVARTPGADARSLALRLTEAGRERVAPVRAARAGAVRAVLERLPADQQLALEPLLAELVSAVVRDRMEQRAGGGVPGGGYLCRLCDFTACGRPQGLCPAATTAQGIVADEDK